MRSMYEALVKDYLCNDFEGASGDALPLSVNLAIDKLMNADQNRPLGISSTNGDKGFNLDCLEDHVRRSLLRYKKMVLS